MVPTKCTMYLSMLCSKRNIADQEGEGTGAKEGKEIKKARQVGQHAPGNGEQADKLSAEKLQWYATTPHGDLIVYYASSVQRPWQARSQQRQRSGYNRREGKERARARYACGSSGTLHSPDTAGTVIHTNQEGRGKEPRLRRAGVLLDLSPSLTWCTFSWGTRNQVTHSRAGSEASSTQRNLRTAQTETWPGPSNKAGRRCIMDGQQGHQGAGGSWKGGQALHSPGWPGPAFHGPLPSFLIFCLCLSICLSLLTSHVNSVGEQPVSIVSARVPSHPRHTHSSMLTFVLIHKFGRHTYNTGKEVMNNVLVITAASTEYHATP